MKFASFSFSFINMNSILHLNSVSGIGSSDVDNRYMNAVGVNSYSIIQNCMSLLSTFITLIWLHVIFLLIRRLLKDIAGKSRIWKKIFDKIYNFMTFIVYLRVLMEANQFLLICSTFEIKQMRSEKWTQILSLIISFLVYIGVIMFTYFIWVKSFLIWIGKSTSEASYFSEYYSETRVVHICRILPAMLTLRRAILVTIEIFAASYMNVLIIVLVWYQTIHCWITVVIRPLKGVSNNIILILNEILFLWLAVMLIFYHQESDWTSKVTNAYMIIITTNSGVVWIIWIGKNDKFSLEK